MTQKKDKLNVLFLTSWYTTDITPCNGDFVQRHAQVVNTLHNVILIHVCFHSKDTFLQKRNILGLEEYIYYVKQPRIKIPLVFSLFKLLKFMRYYFKALKYLRKSGFKPDIIHANVFQPIGVVAYLFSKIYSIPFVISEHSGIYMRPQKSQVSKLPLWRFIAKKAKCVMPVSPSLQRAMESHKIYANYKVVFNVIDNSIFYFGSKTSKKGGIIRFLHLSVCGDLAKNVSGILRAVEKLAEIRSDFELHIVSEVTSDPNFQTSIEQIKYYDILPAEKAAELMQRCDAYVQFSNYETFAIVLAESLACGKPVICTSGVGFGDELTEEYGVTVPIKDEEKLLAAMLYIMDNIDKYDVNKMQAFVKEKLSHSKIAAEFDEIYRKYVKS